MTRIPSPAPTEQAIDPETGKWTSPWFHYVSQNNGIFANPPVIPSYAVADIPAAAPAGQLAFVTDQTGGSELAYSDGTNWHGVRDRISVTTGDIASVNVDDFGAVGDGATDDSSAFNNAFEAVATVGGTGAGGIVWVNSQKKYYIGSDITLLARSQLRGGHANVGIGSNANATQLANYGSCLKVSTAATIRMKGATALDGLLIMRSGMAVPEQSASSYSGTGITIEADDAVIKNCMVLGFNQGISASNANRPRLNRVNIDCVNGVLINNCADIAYLREVHCWPFGTIAATSPTTTWGTSYYLFRNGSGISFTNVADICKVTDCFTFGYATGFAITGAQALTMTGCAADGNSRATTAGAVISGSIGFLIQGGADMITLTNCQVAAQNNGFYINMSASSQEAVLNGCRTWYIEGNGVADVVGSCSVIGGSYRGVNAAGYGINNLSTSNSVIAVGNRLTNTGWIANTNGTLAVNLGNV